MRFFKKDMFSTEMSNVIISYIIIISCIFSNCVIPILLFSLYLPLVYANDGINGTRKAIGFKSLRVFCWEINQLTSKCQVDVLDKICKKV